MYCPTLCQSSISTFEDFRRCTVPRYVRVGYPLSKTFVGVLLCAKRGVQEAQTFIMSVFDMHLRTLPYIGVPYTGVQSCINIGMGSPDWHYVGVRRPLLKTALGVRLCIVSVFNILFRRQRSTLGWEAHTSILSVFGIRFRRQQSTLGWEAHTSIVSVFSVHLRRLLSVNGPAL